MLCEILELGNLTRIQVLVFDELPQILMLMCRFLPR